jgi:uncharacterized protein YdhG (YjbR/CyaY superfamily)
MIADKQFLTKANFTMMIEDAVASYGIPYIDAVVRVCQDNDVDIEEVRKFISPPIKDKLEAEARRLNFLPRLNSLPGF